jgi:hypothetical protein
MGALLDVAALFSFNSFGRRSLHVYNLVGGLQVNFLVHLSFFCVPFRSSFV